MRALGLVAHGAVVSASLVPAVLADRVEEVDELVVAADPAVLSDARIDKVDTVGSSEVEFSISHEAPAVVRRNKLVLHVDAAARSGAFLGTHAEAKVVPGIVGDVVGAAGRVNLQEMDAAAAVADSDADVVAVNSAGPVGNSVGVDVATENTNGRGVLLMRSHAVGSRLRRDEGSTSGDEAGDVLGEHHLE